MLPVYDPTTPNAQQTNDWSCSCFSTWWGMTAYSRHPDVVWVQNQMIADGIVSTDLGLLDGSGAGLAQWITAQWGEFQYAAHNASLVSFDDVVSVAGQTPVLIGGHNWGPGGHWVGVRRYSKAQDWLELANPADGYQGVFQAINRQQFDQFAPFSMVVITWDGPADPVPPPPPPEPPSFVIGDGILKAMVSRGESPAADEQHFGEHGRGWAVAFSTLGRCYTWVDSVGKCVVTEGWGP